MDSYPLRFSNDEDATELIDGIPASEQILNIELGLCIGCGEDASPKGHGMLLNPEVKDGVLSGDAVCIDCVLSNPRFEGYELE